MWNDPVVIFAFDAVVDRGDRYRVNTVNGHRLTLVHATPLSADPDDPNPGETSVPLLRGVQDGLYSNVENTISVDGKSIELPKWSTVWREQLER